MRAILFSLAAAALAFAADTKSADEWNKVKQLKSGTEIRIYKKGAAQPVLAKAADATDDKIIVVLKNQESAIDRNDIDRLDARPTSGKRTEVQSTATQNEPTSKPVDGTRPENYGKPGSSYSSGLSIGSKPDFETIYRRPSRAK